MSAMLQPTVPQRARPTTVATPYLDLDVAAAVTRYRRLAASLPGTAVHYAVKANPEPALLAALAGAGCRFDVASPAEVTAVLDAGAQPADLVYFNPVKRREDVASAARLGVRLFVVDSLEETQKVAASAPGSAVLCRIGTSGAGSDWSLSRKYGCSPDQAAHILRSAAAVGLEPAGLSFHVGSQQCDPGAWDAPIRAAADVFEVLRADGLAPWLLDLGGRLPRAPRRGLPTPSGVRRGARALAAPALRPSPSTDPGRARPGGRRGRRHAGLDRGRGGLAR